MDATNLIAYLPFNESVTQDLIGNTWTANGNPTIGNSALKLDGSSSYLAMDGGITLGGKNFTIACKFYLSSETGSWPRVFSLHKTSETDNNCITLARRYTGTEFQTVCMGTTSNFYSTLDEWHYVEFDYSHADGKFFTFMDGVLVSTISKTIEETVFDYCWLGRSNYSADKYFTGTIDEFMIFDGVALHTTNFTPPTADDYDDLEMAITGLDYVARTVIVDVERKVKNAAKTWRYENYGTADTLTLSGTTLIGLPESKSITTTAFYQTARQKCFDIPATAEVWIKFDVYFDGTNRWRAYNGGNNDITGITAQTNNGLSYFSNGGNSLYNGAGVCKTNQLQTVLLHMVSGAESGVIEAWVDGTKIYRYTGDVNHGEDFADIYLQSDGAGTFFSNVIISNAEIGLEENVPEDSFQFTFLIDVERKVRNAPKLIEQLNKLKVYLPFDESPLDDWCGNVWTVNGSPTIEDSKLKLPGNSSYLAMNGGITLGGQDFTICGKFNMSSSTGSWARLVQIFNTTESNINAIRIARDGTSSNLNVGVFNTSQTTAITLGRDYDFEFNYSHDEGTVRFFLDGVLKITLSKTIVQTTFANFYLGRSNFSADGYFVGTIDEFQIFDGVALFTKNFVPPTDEEYATWKDTLADSAVYAYKIDVETKIRNAPRADTDSGISFTGGHNSYATIPREIFTGSSEFAIEIEFSTTTTRDDGAYIYHPIIIGRDNALQRDNGVNLRLRGGNLVFWETNANTDQNYINTGKFVADGNPHKVAVVSNSDGSLDIYCDDELISHTENFNAVLTSGSWNNPTTFAGNDNAYGNGNDMTLYESRFWSKSLTAEELFADITGDEENLEAWYVPTEKGLLDYTSNMRNATITGTTTYIEFETVFVDVEYESKNDALAWRYEDCAVYFGTGAPIQFHVPKAYELWIRFDVYFDGEARWYAYDDGIFGMTGITALTTLELDYLSAGATIKTLPDVCKAKQTQTFLLHMISDATNGLIEVWAGLKQLESYYGNVNNGRPFVDFVLRSDEAGTSFTELIISNTRLEPDEKPANVVRATKTSQLNTCNTETGVIWLEPGGDYPFPYITYTIREVIRQTIKETIDIGEGEFKPVKSIWVKFDIFNDGVNRWWFYNLNEIFGRSGVCALTNGDMNFVANEVEVQQEADVCAIGQWQTFIIHMESDEINGLIEVMTGDETYTYTGNVNGGEEFTDIYLLSEGDKVVFDNFIVSTAPLDFDSSKRMNTPKRTTTLAFVVRHYDEDVVVPFYFSAVPILNAVAIRWLGCDWYNPLVLPDDANASPIPVRYGGVDYVLSVPT